MRNFDREKEDYNFIVNFIEKNGYKEGNELETEMYPENDHTDGQNYAFIPAIIMIWQAENGDIIFKDENGGERSIDDLDGTELCQVREDLEIFHGA